MGSHLEHYNHFASRRSPISAKPWSWRWCEMVADARGKGVLESFGFTGWAVVADEEMEIMIDLMDTLGLSEWYT